MKWPKLNVLIISKQSFVKKSKILFKFLVLLLSTIKLSIVADEKLILDNDNYEDYDELTDEQIRQNELPDEIFIENEFWGRIEKAFGENKDDHTIFCEWLEGSPRRDISRDLNIPIKDVNNSIKRGLRIIKKIVVKQ